MANIQFWRSNQMSDTSFLDLVKRTFGKTFTKGIDAKNWLIANGYYTSYPDIVTDGLVLYLDAANVDSFKGEPTTNYATFDPWTVGGINTNLTGISNVPVSSSKTWKFEKTGTSDQWNGWEGNYAGTWTGSAGDIWTTSYWYKTSAPAGKTSFGIGAFYKSDWSAPYNTTVLSDVSSIIADGKWHYNYTTTRINEAYTNAIIVDGPSWNYSTSAGVLYINGLQWEKKDHATPFVSGTRGTTYATNGGWCDLSGNNHNGTLGNNTYDINNLGCVVFDGTSSSTINLGIGTDIFPLNQVSLECWVKSSGLGSGMSQGGLIALTYGLYVSIASDGSIIFGVNDNTTTSIPALGSSSVNIFNNTWHHIICTNDGTNSKMYIDGVLNNSGLYTWRGSTYWSNNSFNIGSNNNNIYYYLNGKIASIKVYNKVLSQVEVTQNFNALKERFGL